MAYRDCECYSSKGREFGSDKHKEVAEAAIKHFRAQLHAPVFMSVGGMKEWMEGTHDDGLQSALVLIRLRSKGAEEE